LIHRLLPCFMLLTGLCGLGNSAVAQKALQDWSLEEVLGAIESANGGLNVIEATTNIRVRGSVDTGDLTYEFLLLKKRPDKMRIKMMFKGRSMETGFNGLTGWRRTSQGERDEIVEMSASEFAQANLDVDFDGPLIGPPMAGVERRLMGVERFERVDYFVIEVRGQSLVTRHYIDSRTFREWKTIRETVDDSGQPFETVTQYADYRRLGSIWLAYEVEKRYPGGRIEKISIESAELDPGLLDQVFDVPRNWMEGS
jgi:hypothetical protein